MNYASIAQECYWHYMERYARLSEIVLDVQRQIDVMRAELAPTEPGGVQLAYLAVCRDMIQVVLRREYDLIERFVADHPNETLTAFRPALLERSLTSDIPPLFSAQSDA